MENNYKIYLDVIKENNKNYICPPSKGWKSYDSYYVDYRIRKLDHSDH